MGMNKGILFGWKGGGVKRPVEDMIPDDRYTVHMEMAGPRAKHNPKVTRTEVEDPQRAQAVEEILRRRGIGR